MTDSNGQRSVADECLCYIDFYRDSNNQDNPKKVISNVFTADEILAVKDVLWVKVNGLGDEKVHQDLNFCMHQYAYLSDILAAFKKTDEVN